MELDELYWFVGEKSKTETKENTYVMTMVSRLPRQIVGFDVAFDKSPERIQKIVDSAPEAEYYCTDGYWGYVDIAYPGKHIRNIHDKSNTFTVEGINADIIYHRSLWLKNYLNRASSLRVTTCAETVHSAGFTARVPRRNAKTPTNGFIKPYLGWATNLRKR
ncbi:MAG: hypothetical protein ACI4KM_07505 [Oscillospiraceae bacterium]